MTRIVVSGLFLAAMAGCEMATEPSPLDEVEQVSQKFVTGTSVGRGAPGAYLTPAGMAGLTYTGTDGRINVVRFVSGDWVVSTLNEFSIAGSAIIQFGSTLYLSWFGTDHGLNIMTSSDNGITWGNKLTLTVKGQGYRPNAEPAFVVYGGRLNMFLALVPSAANPTAAEWNAFGTIHHLVLWDTGWAHNGSFAGQTLSGPSAAVLGNQQLVVAWTNRDYSRFTTRKFIPGQGWGAFNPTVRAQEGHLIESTDGSVLWLSRITTGPNTSRLELSRSSDGASFAVPTSVDHSSHARPTLAGATSPHGTPVYFWSHVGTDPNRTLNWSGGVIP